MSVNRQHVFERASKKTGYDSSFIEKVYMAYWRTIKAFLESKTYKQGITEERFGNEHNSVNIPSIGKIYTTYDLVSFHHNQFKEHNDNKESKTNV